MATAVICSFLGPLRFTIVRSLQSACRDRHTPGQMHKLGALMAAVIAAAEDWNTIYFGADTPADEIAAPAARTRASAISIFYARPVVGARRMN